MRHRALKILTWLLLFCVPILPAPMIAQSLPGKSEFVLSGPTLTAPLINPPDSVKENRWSLSASRDPGLVGRFSPGSSACGPPFPFPEGMATAPPWSVGPLANDEDPSFKLFLPECLRHRGCSCLSRSLAQGRRWQAASELGLKTGPAIAPFPYYDVLRICCTQAARGLAGALNCVNADAFAKVASPQSGICQAPPLQQPPSETVSPSPDPAAPLATPMSVVDDILQDQKRIWVFPWGVVAHGRHWKPALAFTLATAGLVELDPHDDPYFRRTQTFSGFNRTFSSFNTGLSEGLFPAAFFLVGRERRDVYAEKTALLAGEALADSEIVSEIMKNVDRRLRPRQIPPYGDFAHTWFKAGGGILINRGSFPSGHAIGAFSMATVIAERYRQHRWVPLVAYGLASLVGFSRITLQAHFPSDIFAGAVLGYAISHYIVLRKQE